jgi:hypothetical protein
MFRVLVLFVSSCLIDCEFDEYTNCRIVRVVVGRGDVDQMNAIAVVVHELVLFLRAPRFRGCCSCFPHADQT